MARTDTLPNFLTDVADAIREKKGTEETIQASDFDTEIVNLPSGGGDISEYFNTTISYNVGTSFHKYQIKKIPSLEIGNNVTSLSELFMSYSNLIEVEGMSGADNVTNFSNLFNSCSLLEKVNFKNFNTSSAISMANMFANCQKLSNVNLNDFNTEKVTDMSFMFSFCTSLVNLDLSSFYTPVLANTNSMFNRCTSLMFLDIRNMVFDNVTSFRYMFGGFNGQPYVPSDCEIIVKSQTEKDWFTTNFSWLTNVKTVAEYEAEQG